MTTSCTRTHARLPQPPCSELFPWQLGESEQHPFDDALQRWHPLHIFYVSENKNHLKVGYVGEIYSSGLWTDWRFSQIDSQWFIMHFVPVDSVLVSSTWGIMLFIVLNVILVHTKTLKVWCPKALTIIKNKNMASNVCKVVKLDLFY